MEVSWMKVRRKSVAKFYDKKIVEGTLANTICSVHLCEIFYY